MERDGADYLLTDKGRDLAPALIALTAWGDRWAAPDGPPILYRHEGCGALVHHQLTCDVHGTLDDRAGVVVEPGPGMPAEHLARMRALRSERR
jgi:hypothetical protein